MFLYSVANVLFVLVCLLLIVVILLQKGKGGTGLFGSMASTQIKIFGGSGGQDFFQKVTWGMGAFVMGLSLLLSVIGRNYSTFSNYSAPTSHVPVQTVPAQSL